VRTPPSIDEDPTVVQTRPGAPRRSPPLPAGSRPPAGLGPASRGGPSGPIDLKSYQGAGAYPKNPLITAAGTLFDLMVELAATIEHPDVAGLQRRVVEEIQKFEQRATAAGCPSDQVLSARYALCSALDETVLLTPWGGESVWSQRSLLSIFQNETWGGEKVFALLQRLRQDPARNLDAIELIGLTLALGFEGRYRVMENGRAEIEDLRNELHREVGRQRNTSPRPLSVDWEGVNTGRGLRRAVPIWVVFAVTGVVILGMFTWFDVRLYQIKGPAIDRVNAIAPPITGS
jgi:type VI secretion system protein ImpK